MKDILWIKTTQCMVRVYDTEEDIVGERVFTVITYHLKNRKILVRFGTKQQIYSLLTQYKNSVVENKEAYERYMTTLSYFKIK